LLLLVFRKKKINGDNIQPEMEMRKRYFDLWPLIFTGLGAIVISLAVGKGYHRLDAIQIWGVKGYGIAADGTLKSVTNWGANTLAYPLHIPILIASFRVLFGDVLPASKMIFGGYYFALVFLSYYTLLKMSVRRWIAGLAVLLIVTSPIIFRHGTIGYANLPTAFYLTCGVVLFMSVFTGELQTGTILLSGIFMVCAAWTRPEGLILSIFGMGLLLLLAYKSKHISLDRRSVLAFLAPIAVYLLFWQVVSMQVYPEPLSKTTLALDAILQILNGELHIQEAFFILYYLFQQLVTFQVWGILGVILLVGCVIVIIYRKLTSLTARVMIVTGCLFLLMIVGMYFLTSFDSSNDLSWWVTSGMNRMNFPGIIILWLGLTGAFHDIFYHSG
jgi:4-amino-4-deoxy-L-arabinose transferase-like glycosyltransferase